MSEAACQQGAPCGNPEQCPDPAGCGFPKDVPDVKAGLEALSQRECLVASDELMSRRGLARKDRDFLVSVFRRDRIAWGDARIAKQDKKESEE